MGSFPPRQGASQQEPGGSQLRPHPPAPPSRKERITWLTLQTCVRPPAPCWMSTPHPDLSPPLPPTPRGCSTGTLDTLGPACPTVTQPLREQNSSPCHLPWGQGTPGQAWPTRTPPLLAPEPGSGVGRRPRQTQQDSLAAHSPTLSPRATKAQGGEHRGGRGRGREPDKGQGLRTASELRDPAVLTVRVEPWVPLFLMPAGVGFLSLSVEEVLTKTKSVAGERTRARVRPSSPRRLPPRGSAGPSRRPTLTPGQALCHVPGRQGEPDTTLSLRPGARGLLITRFLLQITFLFIN